MPTPSHRLFRSVPELARFLIVGGVGFVVDAAVLLLLVDIGRLSPLVSRLPSFLVAVTVTWALHRRFTFAGAPRSGSLLRQWLRFTFANALGNALNLGVYGLLVGGFGVAPLWSLGVASVVAAGVNYAASARWVFRSTAQGRS